MRWTAGGAAAMGVLLMVVVLGVFGANKPPTAPRCYPEAFPGTFHTAPDTTARQAAEGILWLALHRHDYRWIGPAAAVGPTYAVAVKTTSPGNHEVLGLLIGRCSHDDLVAAARDALSD